MEFRAVKENEWGQLEVLASEIWREHYQPIIGSAQVEYMLEKFQSKSAMLEQVANGFEYIVLANQNEFIAYYAVEPRDKNLFLSKFYLAKEARGKGWGKAMLEHVVEGAKAKDFEAIELTVNKYNTDSIAFYLSQGFEKMEAIVIDIGNGYIMDDFRLLRRL